MNDLYTTAINTQKATVQWMDVLADNLTNVYTPVLLSFFLTVGILSIQKV